MKHHIKFYLILAACLLASCMSPEEWLAKNDKNNGGGGDKKEDTPTKIIDEYEVKEAEYEYDTIQIRVKSNSGVSGVEMPKVKFNLNTIMVIISDDMSQNDLTTGWTLFNGYPSGIPYNAYCNDFIKVLTGQADCREVADVHDPWQFSTDDGKARRWAMTTAMWPEHAQRINYTRINAFDAKGMMRTGHSFAQHDVTTVDVNNISLESLASRFPTESKIWKAVTGVGTKIMIEPGGDKRYVEAARISQHICLSALQSTGRGYLLKANGSTYYNKNRVSENDEEIWNNALPNDIEAWAQGDIVPDYNNKTHDCLQRHFITGGNVVYQIGEIMKNGEGKINAFGMHGINKETAEELSKLKNRPGLWVASLDEVWEYYYLKKKTIITYKQDADGTLITLYVPQYNEHQFRDFTLNLDATDVTEVSFSPNVVTSGWRQNNGYCTVNLGLETRTYKYITEYLNIAYQYPSVSCIRRDLEYLIGLLTDNSPKKLEYQAVYNKIYHTK